MSIGFIIIEVDKDLDIGKIVYVKDLNVAEILKALLLVSRSIVDLVKVEDPLSGDSVNEN